MKSSSNRNRTNPSRHILFVGATNGLGLEATFHPDFQADRISVLGRRRLKNRTETNLVTFYPVDITKPAGVEKTIKAVVSTSGELDACVFFQRFRGEGDRWQGEIEVSLSATKRIIECCSSHFKPRTGSVVVVSSVNAHSINPNLGPEYHVCKTGMNHLVRYFAVTLGVKGITVNSISAGSFTKESNRARIEKNSRLMAAYKSNTPLGRMARAEDIINCIQLFLSPHARFITGQDIVIDGGLSLILQDSLIQKLR